ncbi:hypothetical protein GCM10011332_11420 [Terasakiella brassicae]|uniref:Tetratricopeptide repeat protein n=1 Tax=Terasakiella brassicae TaxID=1634917 RepID=A0A917F9E5_9PROT|nr:hypothetical protein [Terasakiella brassicae]GGF59519.1 hypothetical protein GCM10011332_11420 [Terasakiella brassicae]
MVSIFNQFVDWFLKREEGTDEEGQGPLALMQDIGDVHVLIAEPEGKFASDEAKEALLQGLVIPLNERVGLSARRTAHVFKRTNKGTLENQFEDVLRDGRALLQKEGADLLIWGKVEPELQSVRWYFLSGIVGNANLGMPGFAENLLVPFEPDMGSLDVLYAAIFAACVPSHPSQALKIGEHLLNAVDPLTRLPAGLSPRKTSQPVKVSTMGMCAVVLANIARRAKELGWFDPALKAFKTWEDLVEKDKTPQEWALVNNHYGWLFEEMAAHKDDKQAAEHIEQAIRHFEGVCTVFTPKSYPLEWAAVQMRIAGMCARMGRSLSEPDYLQKAARYFKKSLDVYTQKRYPLNWADAMSHMAKALMLHGQMVKGAQSLEQAGVAFQAVLKVYTPEKYPAQWANTQNNLGATLFALAKRDPSTVAWIEHALMCFNEARAYYAENGKVQLAHVIDKNILRAQSLKEQIEENIENDLLN